MRTLYVDCSMGAAGDMLTAALLELLPDKEGFVKKLNDLGLDGVTFELEKSVKCGITGSHMSVKVNGEEEDSHDLNHEHEHNHEYVHEHNHERNHDHEHSHHHSSMADIEHIVRGHLDIPEKVKNDVLAVYELIAEAESFVHGKPVTDIHFHEVGTKDAIADVTAVCLLMNEIGADKVVVSPVHVGSGQVKCAHGILPVPAPATAYILKEVPIYSGNIKGELCTPTGAALLKHFATEFGKMPVMRVSAIGYGMGKKDFEAANCVRVSLGEAEASAGDVVELSCNIDDMTGEAIGFAMDRLLSEGALDVYTTPIGMKKNRPGVMLSVICRPSDKEKLVKVMFKHTSTLGIRENTFKRYTLDREFSKISTKYGEITVKKSSGFGTLNEKFEFDEIKKIAEEKGLSLSDIIKNIK